VTEVLKDVARDARAAVLGVTSIAEPVADAAVLRRGEDAVLAQAGLPELGSVDGVVSIHTEVVTLEHTESGARSKIRIDPWAMLGWLADRKGDPRQTPLLSPSVHEFARRYPQGGPGDAVRARLVLARHRRGGDVLLYYHRAWQRIDQVNLPGSATDSADACDPAEAAAVFKDHLRNGHDRGTTVTPLPTALPEAERRTTPDRRANERRRDERIRIVSDRDGID
jgi:hypothetical protein